MKIEFDTQNPNELKIVAEVLSRLGGRPANDNLIDAQPEVARNAGTTASEGSPRISPVSEGSGVSGGEAATAASTPAAEKRRGRPPKAKVEAAPVIAPAPVAPVAEEIKIVRPAPVAAPAPVVEAEPEFEDEIEEVEAPATLDDVRAALQHFTARHGLPDGLALLKTFRAQRISELAADDYAAFIKACQA